MRYHPELNYLLFAPQEEVPAALIEEQHDGWKMVKFTYAAAVELTALGYECPDILHAYPFPCPPNETPLYGQKDVCRHMLLHPRSFVLSDTRTGKTRPALWAADFLMDQTKARLRCLVVSDIIALAKTWEAEIRSCLLGRRRAINLTGAAATRIRNLSLEADFYLINPEGLRIPEVRDALTAREDLQICIFDEATTYRNAQTAVSRAARQVSKDRLFVWGLTGTPSPNGPLDVYGLKRLVHPDFKWSSAGAKDGTFFSFRLWQDAVTRQCGPFLRVPRPNAPRLVDALLSPAIRIARARVFTETKLRLDAPLEAPLTPIQAKYLKELKAQLLILLENGTAIPAVNQAALRIKLLQIASGIVYDEDGYEHPIDATPRLALLDRLIAECSGKIIVLCPFISTVRMIFNRYKQEAVHMRSDLTRAQKMQLLNEWARDKEKKILASHPAPIARGIDLSCAATICWYAPIDRAEHYLQGCDRINSPAQKSVRTIHRIATTPVELEIYDRLETRKDMLNAILALKEMKFDEGRQ